MKTIYINLDAVPMEGTVMAQQASGGQGPVYRAVVVPARRPASARRGEVLDFEACRQALEEHTPPAEPQQPDQSDTRPAPRRWSVGLILDVVVSAAVVAMAAAITVQFFL